jgi:hypothetical protein
MLSYIFWGFIIVIPFLKLGFKTTSLAISILFICSNIFWLGVFPAGKELLVKLKIWFKNKMLPDKEKSA